MRISDWSSDVCSSDLTAFLIGPLTQFLAIPFMTTGAGAQAIGEWYGTGPERGMALVFSVTGVLGVVLTLIAFNSRQRSEEHTSELQSLMRTSYAVSCLTEKTHSNNCNSIDSIRPSL